MLLEVVLSVQVPFALLSRCPQPFAPHDPLDTKANSAGMLGRPQHKLPQFIIHCNKTFNRHSTDYEK